jgi:ligand-binding SRPBCC domain-containing protein
MASRRNDFATGLFVHRCEIPASAERVFAWHCRPETFQELVPPWERAEVIVPAPIENGAEMTLRLGCGPLRATWVARIYDVVEGRRFRDLQLRGPFRYWQHSHLMEPIDDNRCLLEDRVTYALWGGHAAHLIAGWLVRRKLRRLFEFRHEVTRAAVSIIPP